MNTSVSNGNVNIYMAGTIVFWGLVLYGLHKMNFRFVVGVGGAG